MAKSTVRNYADSRVFDDACRRFGGREYLERNYPEILKLLENTRKWHQSLSEAPCGESKDEKGPTDLFQVEEIPCFDSGTNEISNEPKQYSAVYSMSTMNLCDDAAFLHMSSEISDPDSGKVFAAYAVSDQMTHKIEKGIRVNRNLLPYMNDVTVQSKTDFVAVNQINGTPVISSERREVTDEIRLHDLQSDIKTIEVTDPPPASGEDITSVVYNRSDKKAKYSFTEVKVKEYDRMYVEVFLPFSVTVTLQDYCTFSDEPIRCDRERFSMSLYSDVIYTGDQEKYGAVQFNSADEYLKKLKYTLSGDKKTLTFQFPYSPKTRENYWGVAMPLTAAQTKGDFDFHLNFKIYYKTIFSEEELYTDIVVASSGSYPESDNLRKVNKLHILWGCLGKDSLVLDASGARRRVDSLQVGDKLCTDQGVRTICNIVTGYEEKMIQVGIAGEEPLLLSDKHPVATDRGIVMASALAPGDALLGESGSQHPITLLDTVSYRDTVYSLELEDSALIYANGIAVGDYHTVPDRGEIRQTKPEPLDPKLLAELEAWTKEKNARMAQSVTEK